MDSDFSKFTGIGWGIDFHQISNEWDEAKCQQYTQNIKQKYAKLTTAWSDDLHSEWVTRNYLAVKMILSASVMLTSLEYCREKNVRIVQPYLLYYAAISCCRAVHFTSPDFQLQNTDLYAMTHQKIINVTGEHLQRQFPGKWAKAKLFFEELRADREMFSYKFPALGFSGSENANHFDRVVELCSLLAENAELNSECLEASFRKNVKGEHSINPEIVKLCFLYESDAGVHLDREDYYRTDYMKRKMNGPYCLSMMATEGLVEDFFRSWFPEEDDKGHYNPDDNWQIIFPFR